MSILEKPLGSPQAYVAYLAACELPVLRQTVRQLATMSDSRDSVHARSISGVVYGDTLFAIRLIVWLARHRRRSQTHDITTLDRAIMMMGVDPFFETFSDLPTVEDRLANDPQALIEVLHVFAWARRASQLARDWAILRHDIDVEEVALATLLRPACDILLWIFAPGLSREILERLRQTPGLRSVVAEHQVLGCTKREILLGLAQEWHFPELLGTLIDPANGSNPRVRNVAIACDFARHYAREGWESPALGPDFNDLTHLLPIGRQQLLDRLEVPPEIRERWAAPDAQ